MLYSECKIREEKRFVSDFRFSMLLDDSSLSLRTTGNNKLNSFSSILEILFKIQFMYGVLLTSLISKMVNFDFSSLRTKSIQKWVISRAT